MGGRRTAALRQRAWLGVANPLVLLALFLGVIGICAMTPVQQASADDGKTKPSVLVIDAGLGDYELELLHWLGDESTVVAQNGAHELRTNAHPSWWEQADGTGTAPSTFVLGATAPSAVTVDTIAWALDQIRVSGAEPRTFALAFASAGLPLREYAEDLASQKQSARADLVGMGFCGTPHNGYSVLELYGESAMWESLAQSAGLKTADLAPGSAYLAKLNDSSFPRMTKTLVSNGVVGDLGFGLTDGAGVTSDFALADAVTDQSVASQVNATVSQELNLTGLWSPFTSSIDYGSRAVDSKLVERLSAMPGYETSEEVRVVLREFYDSWFADGAPVTHNSNVLLLDLSGSMVERIDGNSDKLSAAKDAARQYLQAMRSCSGLPQSAPMDVSVHGFNVAVSKVCDGYGDGAFDAINRMTAQGETDIGIALVEALNDLESAPTCASKRILLLSDGESTQGLTDEQMLSGPVAAARDAGIVIDAIGFGDVGESDAGFLQQVATQTGGTYYQASDTYSLKVNFLKSYYSSLGLSLVDEEVPSGASNMALGEVDDRAVALELGILPDGELPDVTLLRDGSPLPESEYATVRDNDLVSLQCVNPAAGSYTLEISRKAPSVHVFAVKQQGIPRIADVAGEQQDNSMLYLAIAGAALVIALIGVVVVTRRRSKPSQTPQNAARISAAERRRTR